MKRFQNKICLITASSTGIGLAIAHRFASEGATVIISSRSTSNVASAVDQIKSLGYSAVGFPCHVGNKKDREKLINFIETTYGRLDVLVPNAAVSTFFGDFFEIKEEQMDKMYEVNLKSTFLLVREALGLLKKGTNPNICIVSSYAAFEPDLTIAFYSITKTALIGLMKVIYCFIIRFNIEFSQFFALEKREFDFSSMILNEYF
jgi:dehydrogenase/reductase SDR family protein 4